jgi:uncharacterized protein YydD (DUF2326 family)
MENLAKVEEREELLKDMKSGAVLLSDRNVMNEYRSKKSMMKNVRDVTLELNTIKERLSKVDKLESDMQEIKELLRGLAK